MDILRVIIPFRQVGKKGKLDPALTLHETLYEHPLLKSFFTLELRKKDSVIYYLKFECTYISNVLLGKWYIFWEMFITLIKLIVLA